MQIKTITMLLLLSATGALTAQQSADEKVDALAEEVRKLKLEKAAPAAEYKSYSGLGPAASKVYYNPRGLSIGGYGELKYSNYIGQETGDKHNWANYENDGFDAHRFILYTGYKFTDNIVLNTELEVEHADEIYLEFATIDFILHDAFNVRTGLILVPMGIVNEYHEPTVFRGVNRPDIEKNIIPSTWRELGTMIYGQLPANLNYKVSLQSGLDATGLTTDSWVRGGRTKGSKSNADALSGAARLDYIDNLLTVGVTGYYGGLNYDPTLFNSKDAYDDALSDSKVTMFDGHLTFQYKGLELKGLYVMGMLDGVSTVNKQTGENVGKSVNGWYVELGYDIFPLISKGESSLIPFVRYEQYNLNAEVASDQQSDNHVKQTRLTAGIDYKPIANIVLKLDYQANAAEKNKNDPDVLTLDKQRINAALGFIF